MEFDLTNELIKQITFAMENQTELFVFDSEEKVLKKKEDISKSFDSDEKSGSFQKESQVDNRYFSLPEWNSVLGFKMMEKFVSVLNNPLARSDLKHVLSLQKGVFRNFKDTLSAYPEVEKLWYTFKDGEMKKLVLDWYNRHREAWGLDLLPVEFNETEALIFEDFLFRFSFLEDEISLYENCQKLFCEELLQEASDRENVNEMLSFLWKDFQQAEEQKNKVHILIVETIEKDFAGLATFFQTPTHRGKTMLITFVYVDKAFRGLGLGNELLQALQKYCKEQNVRMILAHNAFVPDVFSKILMKNNFEKINGVFFAFVLD